jgi:putative aminopeptidase FrvX
MFVFDLIGHLKNLSEAHGPSGHEGIVRGLLRQTWAGFVDEFDEDRLGSLIGVKRGAAARQPARRVMLAAHMDEIGMMVAEIREGFILVHRINGVDNRLMLAQPVLVHGREALPGVVAAKPPHLLAQAARQKYPTFDELVIDVGLPAERVEALVRPGDLITIDAPFVQLNGKRVSGKALDNRACLAALTLCLHELSKRDHAWDVYAVATVQEEVGLRGAAAAAYAIAPDLAIALDVGFAQQPGVEADVALELGGGPGIGIGPNFHPHLVEKLREAAQRIEIKLQDDILPGQTGTDAWAIQVAREGIPTALLEIPLRNMHSPVEIADLRDIERCGRLLALFIAELEDEFLSAMRWPQPNKAAPVKGAA